MSIDGVDVIDHRSMIRFRCRPFKFVLSFFPELPHAETDGPGGVRADYGRHAELPGGRLSASGETGEAENLLLFDYVWQCAVEDVDDAEIADGAESVALRADHGRGHPPPGRQSVLGRTPGRAGTGQLPAHHRRRPGQPHLVPQSAADRTLRLPAHHPRRHPTLTGTSGPVNFI